MSPIARIAPGSPACAARLYQSIAWPASRGHPMPLAYLCASSVISAGVCGSGKADCPAASTDDRANHAMRVRPSFGLIRRARSLIRGLQVLRRFFLRILRVVFCPNRLRVFVDRPFPLAGDIEDLTKVDVAPYLGPLRFQVSVQGFPERIRGRLV